MSRGPRHVDLEVCPGGPNHNINFMMKFSVGLATNPYKRLCWMANQLLLSVGPSGSLLLTGKDRWMLNIPYQRTSIVFIDSYTDNFYSRDHV